MARPAQGGGSAWIGARPTPGATALLAALVGAFLALLFLPDGAANWVVSHFALTPRQALGLRPWQLVTSALVHSTSDPSQKVHLNLGAFLSDLFGVWIFATAIEQQLGRQRML